MCRAVSIRSQERRFGLNTALRWNTYSVAAPNSLWHLIVGVETDADHVTVHCIEDRCDQAVVLISQFRTGQYRSTICFR